MALYSLVVYTISSIIPMSNYALTQAIKVWEVMSVDLHTCRRLRR